MEEWFKNNVAAKEGWEKLILSIKFYAKSSLFLYPDIQDIDLWKKTFPESNVGIFGYRLLSKFTRLFMFLCLHKMKYIGMLLNNLKYSIMKNNQHENVT